MKITSMLSDGYLRPFHSAMQNIEAAQLQQRTLIAIVPTVDYVGLLADILGQIAFFGINLLKIHSRPAPSDDDGPAPQMFYLETDTPAGSPELRLCFETLEMRLAKQGHGKQAPPPNPLPRTLQ